MPEPRTDLGKLVAIHVMSPAHAQRSVFMIVLSFLFFLAMMLVFYVRQSLLFFILASAFLVIYLLTLISFVIQRQNTVQVFENGIKYRKHAFTWSDVEHVQADGTISLANYKKVILPRSVNDIDNLLNTVTKKIVVRE